jgi:hypothetical protein
MAPSFSSISLVANKEDSMHVHTMAFFLTMTVLLAAAEESPKLLTANQSGSHLYTTIDMASFKTPGSSEDVMRNNLLKRI